ncbi:MAG: phage holin family protein [Myxococcota bacterium]|jgi:Putative Actinobacterial Holin-X, holin superfamily III|nr:phage holin family protein [Myxococcota bacterium]
MTSSETTVLDPRSPSSTPTPELVRQAVEEARDLLQLEIRLAREEAREDFARYRRLGYEIGTALVALNAAVSTLILAAVLAAGAAPTLALAIGGALLLVSVALAFHVYHALPGFPLQRTLSRWKTEVQELKEHAL